MNSRLGLFSCFFALFLSVAVLASEGGEARNKRNGKSPLLRAVIDNLPDGCKELHRTGMFNALSAGSYDCLFESSDDEKYKKAAAILVLLNKNGQRKLVEEVARKWVKKAHWGPFNQDEIAKQLSAVASVRPESFVASSTSKNKKKKNSTTATTNNNNNNNANAPESNETVTTLFDHKTVYETFKILMENGKGLIVPGPDYNGLLVRIMKLVSRIDESAKDRSSSINNVIFYFLAIDKDTLEEMSEAKSLANVFAATEKLNNLAERGDINNETWNLLAPLICSELNKQFPTAFSFPVAEAQAENSTIEISSKFASEKTEAILKDLSKVSNSRKNRSAAANSATSGNSTGSPSDSERSNELTGLWLIIAGLGVLLVIAVFGIFHARSAAKRDEEEDI